MRRSELVVLAFCLILSGPACSMYSEAEQGVFGGANPKTAAAEARQPAQIAPADYQAAEKVRKVQPNILYYVQTVISVENLKDYPLPERHCQITRINFKASGIPFSIASTGTNMFIESEVKDVIAFKQYSEEALSWWRIKAGRIEDIGSRLMMRVKTRRTFDFATQKQAVFDYYASKYEDVKIGIACQELPEWIVSEYPVDWQNIIREAPATPEANAKVPRRKIPRN